MCKKRNVLGCVADATSFMGYNNIQHFALQSWFYCTIILKAQGVRIMHMLRLKVGGWTSDTLLVYYIPTSNLEQVHDHPLERLWLAKLILSLSCLHHY